MQDVISTLATKVKPCLEELDPLPQGAKLFRDDLFGFDINVNSFASTKTNNIPLSLVEPEFECPMPPLRPAVYEPNTADLPMPALDRLNLDHCFAPKKTKLNQLTNKYAGEGGEGDDALERYVKEAGRIILGNNHASGKKVLSILLEKIQHSRNTRTTLHLPIKQVY